MPTHCEHSYDDQQGFLVPQAGHEEVAFGGDEEESEQKLKVTHCRICKMCLRLQFSDYSYREREVKDRLWIDLHLDQGE